MDKSESIENIEKAKVFGILAEFSSPGEVMSAAEKVRDKGYSNWDVHSPFPIHGMNEAMGLSDSKLGYIAGACAMIGVLGGFTLQYWVSTSANRFVIAGKPFNSYPAFVPVTFEPGILLTAFGCVFGMFFLNRLPTLYHALFKSKNFHRFSDNGFFISIEATDSRFHLLETQKLLEEIGGRNIEVLED